MVQIGFKCNRGLVRENNEDACFVIPSHDVYIVADGVGGNKSGEVASRTAVSEIAQLVSDAELKKLREPEEIFGFFSGLLKRPMKQYTDWERRKRRTEEWPPRWL